MLGAVGNVARNVTALGGSANIVSVVGDDDEGRTTTRLIAEDRRIEADLITVPVRRTSVKTRFVASNQPLLRADHESLAPLESDFARKLTAAVEAELKDADALVLSDYAKGVLAGDVLATVIKMAQQAGVPTIADPKSRDLSQYAGATLIKPNAYELEIATGMPCNTDEEVERAGTEALKHLGGSALLVSRSESGMSLFLPGEPSVHVRDRVAEVFDVSGAGDTAAAVLALALGAQAGEVDATRLANKACSIVVGKVGTATVAADEFVHNLQAAEFDSVERKVLDRSELLEAVARWRSKGLQVGFTNGCFDLIHQGHVSLLSQAKAVCDRLIVALNDDDSVRRLKGPDRPINSETARAIVLASLSGVDRVVLFSEDTPLSLIEAVKPDVLIKGADYREDEVVGGAFVKQNGGRIHLAKLEPGTSTTGTINRIKS